jgi:antitoxin ParD1/3/4
MPTIQLELPDALREFVETRAMEQGFPDLADYIRAVLEEERKRATRLRVDQLLLEGLQSGPSVPMTPEEWDEIRQEVRERQTRRNPPS